MKMLVVDDEQLAVDNLTAVIAKFEPEATVISATDSTAAVDLFFSEKPDLVFLDINMPGITGIELAKIFTNKAGLIFVTAYSEHAIEAFEVSAIDYLLKPVNEKRLEQALAKAKRNLQQGGNFGINDVKDALSIIAKQTNTNRAVIAVKEVGKIKLIDVNDISYLVGSGNYVEIYLNNGQMILHRESLSVMEEKLSHEDFVRIHRSSLIRQSVIKELLCNKRGDYTVVLHNDTQLPVARNNKAELLSIFK